MAREESFWGKATINGEKYEMAAPCVPQVLPDVVPALRTGPTALEHRIGARWWGMSDWSLGLGGELLDIYSGPQGLAWAENVDGGRGSYLSLGYKKTAEENLATAYNPPPVYARPMMMADAGGIRCLYVVYGNTAKRRKSDGTWETVGTMTDAAYGRMVLNPIGPGTVGTVMLFVGEKSDGSDAKFYCAKDGLPANFMEWKHYATANAVVGKSATILSSADAGASQQADIVLVGKADGTFQIYRMAQYAGEPKAGGAGTKVFLTSTPYFLSPAYPNYRVDGVPMLVQGELRFLFWPNGIDQAAECRLRWGKNLVGGCLHGPSACVYRGLRMWLVDASGREEDISPSIEELAGFASGTDLAFTSVVSDGNNIYATVRFQSGSNAYEYLWRYDGQGWQCVADPLANANAHNIAALGLVLGGYIPSESSLWWLTTHDGDNRTWLRRYTMPQGVRMVGRDAVTNNAVGKVLSQWFAGGSPESGTLYKHWIEHTIPNSAQITITKRINYGSYDNSDLSPNTITGGATVERKTTFITCGGASGLPFSSVQFQYGLVANSSGQSPRIHRVGYEWYKATKVKLYPVYLAFHSGTRDMGRKLVQTLLSLTPDALYTITIPYVCTNEKVRFVGSQPTGNSTVIRFDFQTV